MAGWVVLVAGGLFSVFLKFFFLFENNNNNRFLDSESSSASKWLKGVTKT